MNKFIFCHFYPRFKLLFLTLPLLFPTGAFPLEVEAATSSTNIPAVSPKGTPVLSLPPLTAVAVDRQMKTIFSPFVEKFYNLVTDIMKAPENDRSSVKLDPMEVKETFSWYLKADLSNGADYQNPKGRYQDTLKMLVAALKTTRPALVKRVMQGDLLPLRQYTEEVFAAPGAPAIPKTQQLYYLVNQMLLEEADPQNVRGDQPLRTAMPEKFKEVTEFISKYDQALEKLPSFSGIVFRGTGLDIAKVREIEEQESGTRTEPVILFSPTYVSTTLDIGDGMAFLRARAKTISHGKMPTLMVIDGVGKLASIAGQFVREEEMVIPRNSKLQVLRSVTVNFAEEEEKPWNVLILFARELP